MTTETSITGHLTVDDLKAIRLEILQRYNEGMNEAEKAFEQGLIKQSKFNEAVGQLQKLKNQSTELLGLITSLELDALLKTDKNSPVLKIKKATENLTRSTQNIGDILNFLQSIAEVIRIASGIIVAIQTGVIAKI